MLYCGTIGNDILWLVFNKATWIKYEMGRGYMEIFKVLEIKQSVFDNNDRGAELLREELDSGLIV